MLYDEDMTLQEEITSALRQWEGRTQFNARDATTDVMGVIANVSKFRNVLEIGVRISPEVWEALGRLTWVVPGRDYGPQLLADVQTVLQLFGMTNAHGGKLS